MRGPAILAACAAVWPVSLGAERTGATELLTNGDFAQDWEVGWSQVADGGARNQSVATGGAGLRLQRRGTGQLYLWQRVDDLPTLDVTFRAQFTSRSLEHLNGIGWAGLVYVGVGYLDDSGTAMGFTRFYALDCFCVDLGGSQRRPVSTATSHFVEVPSGKLSPVEVTLAEELRTYLTAIDPARVQGVVVVLGIGNYRDESEGILEVDWVSLSAPSPLVVDFHWSPASPMAGGPIEFRASEPENSDGGVPSYLWDFGDGECGLSTGPAETHQYAAPGSYDVTLTVTGGNGEPRGVCTRTLDLSLVPGDLLLIRSESSLIPTGEWTHVAMYTGLGGDADLVEAAQFGDSPLDPRTARVGLSPFSRYAHPDAPNARQGATWVRVLRVRDPAGGITEAEMQRIRADAVQFALDRVGDHYDIVSFGVAVTQAAWPLIRLAPVPAKQLVGPLWYCSELVWAAYLSASNWKINLDGPEPWSLHELTTVVHPDEIAASHWVAALGEHLEHRPDVLMTLPPSLEAVACSPVDLVVMDPQGRVLSKEQAQIPGSVYWEFDGTSDYGSLEDFLYIPEPSAGTYSITVVPERGVPPEEPFSVLVGGPAGTLATVADQVPVGGLTNQPYSVVVTERGSLEIGETAIAATEPQATPAVPALVAVYPNPFNGCTTVRYTVPNPGPVRLVAHDVTGQCIRLLVNQRQTAGTHQVEWDGRVDDGNQAASGVYLISLEVAGTVQVSHVTLIR